MRAVANGIFAGLSAVLLSGCSWLGAGLGYDNSSYYGNQTRSAQHNSKYGIGAYETGQYGSGAYGNQSGAYAGQQAQYTTGGYGSHVGSAQTAGYIKAAPTVKRPTLRGSFGLEFDHSLAGTLYDTANGTGASAYNRAAFAEAFQSGVIIDGDLVTTTYTSTPERILAPEISFDDIYTAPLRVSGGLEYIFSDHASAFANVGYTISEAKSLGSSVVDSLTQSIRTDTFDAAGLLVGSIVNTTAIPNQTVATFSYDFNDMRRLDLELGGRYYFNPVMTNEFSRTLTPFVSASGGAAHYNATSVTENQRQLFLQRSFDSGAVTNDFYDVSFGTPTQLYDAQWVPYGALKGGLEWQMTPRTALAFEAGVKYEKQRDFSSGVKGEKNITIPVGIRGSYNF